MTMRKPMFLRFSGPCLTALAVVTFLLACTPQKASTPTVYIDNRTDTSSRTASFTSPPPTPTFTVSPSITPTTSRVETHTITPTLTPSPFNYVFPLQPASVAAYLEGTKAHGYPATDIFAAVGTKFVAVTDGIVDYVSLEDTWDPATDDPATRGGLSVAIIGDDGVRYYGSHLSMIAEGIQVGVHVKTGQLLGRVGQSGDARSTYAHVHFGISRPTTPDDWKARRGQVDPFPFLQAWKDGHDVTPPLPVR